MSLDMVGKQCKVEIHADEDGVRLICNTVDDDSCPLHHPGELGLDCFRGEPTVPDSHMVVTEEAATETVSRKKRRLKRFGEMIQMPEEEKQEEQEEESMFEEAPDEPTELPSKKDVVTLVEDDDDQSDAWFEPVIEEFDTKNDYVFGLVAAKDDEGEVMVTLTIDNVNIDIKLEDFIELAKALRDALPRLKQIYMEE